MEIKDEKILKHYRDYGYAIIPNALSKEEVNELNLLVDEDIANHPSDWGDPSNGASSDGNILLKYPELDRYIRHPRVFPLIQQILQEKIRFAQIDFRDVPKDLADNSGMHWHRDIAYFGTAGGKIWDPDNPYLSTYTCVIYYLKDVHECCPCFGMVPNSHEYDSIEEAKAGLGDAYREVPIRGEAGTAVLYNITTYHTRINGKKDCPHGRRTMHNYHSRESNSPLTNWVTLPEKLALSDDNETRRFYSQWTPGQIQYAIQNYKGTIPSYYPTTLFKKLID